MPFDPKIKRTEGTISLKDDPSGKVFKCTKGAPQVSIYRRVIGVYRRLVQLNLFCLSSSRIMTY